MTRPFRRLWARLTDPGPRCWAIPRTAELLSEDGAPAGRVKLSPAITAPAAILLGCRLFILQRGCMGAESREHMMAVYLARRHGFVRGDWRGRA